MIVVLRLNSHRRRNPDLNSVAKLDQSMGIYQPVAQR